MNKNIYKGIAFSALIAIFAYFLGKKFPVVGGPVFGILLGIILNNFKRPESLESGIKFTSKKTCFSSSVLGVECALPAACSTISNTSVKTGILRAISIL